MAGGRPVVPRGVNVVETARPEGEEGLNWQLLTSLQVSSAEKDGVSCYRQRRRADDILEVLKSGWMVQDQLSRTAERLQKAVALQCVIAWRIMVSTLQRRVVPQCAAELLFEGDELEFPGA